MGKSNNRGQGKGAKRKQSPRKTQRNDKLIIRFFPPAFDNTPITVKFQDALEEEVKEPLHCWKDIDNKAKLIEVYKEVIQFGTTYGYGEAKYQKLDQALSRASSGNA